MTAPDENAMYARLKRPIDVLLGLALLPFALPVILFAYLLVTIESPGGGFFLQRRVGYLGDTFVIVKLRSMYCDADISQSAKRITTVGGFLRKHRIDEVPQILNILKGEMSFVGPRPEVVASANLYRMHIPDFDHRLTVRPGLSGYAQINQGYVTDVADVVLKVKHDIHYIQNISFSMDAKILLMTVWVAVAGRKYC